ncbi:MAG: SHOCT domain-containing protein [Actinomycetota bacterium]|nr:SHOCT domain-containing protein [Actinomycetota bacterium]
MSGRFGPRLAVVVSTLALLVGIAGVIATLVLNAFVLDDYDAYGEVPIPGVGEVHLPEGDVNVSFHTLVTGQPTSGFPIPRMSLSIEPPEGVADPVVIESIGATTTVNSDTHVRVWTAHISQGATYRVTTDGDVNGYISPRLAFGHGSSHGWLPWVFGALGGAGAVLLIPSVLWSLRAAKRARPLTPDERPPTSDQG